MASITSQAKLLEGLQPISSELYPTSQGEVSKTGMHVPDLNVIDALNVMPTLNGYTSFFGENSKVGVDAIPTDCQDIITYRTFSGNTICIAFVRDGIYVKSLAGDGTPAITETATEITIDLQEEEFCEWTRILTTTPMGVWENWTHAMIRNKIYLYQKGFPYILRIDGFVFGQIVFQKLTPMYIIGSGQNNHVTITVQDDSNQPAGGTYKALEFFLNANSLGNYTVPLGTPTLVSAAPSAWENKLAASGAFAIKVTESSRTETNADVTISIKPTIAFDAYSDMEVTGMIDGPLSNATITKLDSPACPLTTADKYRVTVTLQLNQTIPYTVYFAGYSFTSTVSVVAGDATETVNFFTTALNSIPNVLCVNYGFKKTASTIVLSFQVITKPVHWGGSTGQLTISNGSTGLNDGYPIPGTAPDITVDFATFPANLVGDWEVNPELLYSYIVFINKDSGYLTLLTGTFTLYIGTISSTLTFLDPILKSDILAALIADIVANNDGITICYDEGGSYFLHVDNTANDMPYAAYDIPQSSSNAQIDWTRSYTSLSPAGISISPEEENCYPFSYDDLPFAIPDALSVNISAFNYGDSNYIYLVMTNTITGESEAFDILLDPLELVEDSIANYPGVICSVVNTESRCQVNYTIDVGFVQFNETDTPSVLTDKDGTTLLEAASFTATPNQLAQVEGIFKARDRLGAWTKDNRIHWSSAADPVDFLPSKTTQANELSVNAISGNVVKCLGFENGFIIYATGNVVAGNYVGGQFIYDFKAVGQASGTIDPRHITGNNFDHFYWGANGLVLLNPADRSAKILDAAFTDWLNTYRFPLHLRLISDRYLVIGLQYNHDTFEYRKQRLGTIPCSISGTSSGGGGGLPGGGELEGGPEIPLPPEEGEFNPSKTPITEGIIIRPFDPKEEIRFSPVLFGRNLYPSFCRSLIFDVLLSRWGTLDKTHALLYSLNPINQQGFPIEKDYYLNDKTLHNELKGLAMLDETGISWLCDTHVEDSYVLFGKYSTHRYNSTKLVEVFTEFAHLPEDTVIQIERTLDQRASSNSNLGDEIIYDINQTAPVTRIQNRTDLNLGGKWFNILVRGKQFHLKRLMARGYTYGR